MNARTKLEDVVGVPLPTNSQIANTSKPSWLVRMGVGVLRSLQDSREREAARLIRRHRDLIQDRNAIELLRP